MAPKMNAIVLLFHFLCQCSSSFSNCLKYCRYLSLENTALYDGILHIPMGIKNIIDIIKVFISPLHLMYKPSITKEKKQG